MGRTSYKRALLQAFCLSYASTVAMQNYVSGDTTNSHPIAEVGDLLDTLGDVNKEAETNGESQNFIQAEKTNVAQSEPGRRERAQQLSIANMTWRAKQIAHCKMWEVLPHDYDAASKVRQVCKGDFGMSQSSAERRFAVLLRGESFCALGGMYDRHIDVNSGTFACQVEASKSHVDMIIAPIEACGYKVDIFVKTYKANDAEWKRNSSKELLDMYGGRVVDSVFDPHAVYEKVGLVKGLPPQASRYAEGLQMVLKYSNEHALTYDALLIIRSDLIFKRPLGDLRYQKVMFAFREWEMLAGDYVADTIHYFPWKYMNCAVLEGFREHFSGGIRDRIGVENLGFLTKELHDSNSMSDMNPVYKMCRPEQKYDIHGGFVILVFGYFVPTPDQIERVGLGVRNALRLQAEPKSLPPGDVVAHTWIKDRKSKTAIGELVRLRFGQVPAMMKFEQLPNTTDLERYLASFIIVTKLSEASSAVAERHIWARRKTGRPFRFDRLVFLRNDYVIKSSEIQIYRCNTEVEVCVGFGGHMRPELPVLIISGHEDALSFTKLAPQLTVPGGELKEDAVIGLFQKAFKRPLRVFCREC